MKVLALVDAPDHVCCRYRIRAFEPALNDAGATLTLRGLARGALGRWSQFSDAAEYDTVILQRKLLPGWQLRQLRRRARRLVFDFDDAVLYRDSYDSRGPHCPRRARRFAQVVRLADVVIAGNRFLADCALRAGAPAERIRVIPTCVDTHRNRPRPESTDAATTKGRGLDLVWIGSSSTLQGLEAKRTLWERIAREVPGVRLRVICDRFPDFGPMPVVGIPWAEASEAQALAAGDVGISWIPDDLWSRGKCGLKVLQYQAAGLPVLANPVGVHPEMITPEVSGILVDSDDAWVEAVRTLAADPDMVRRLGENARANAEARYSIEAWGDTFATTVLGHHRSITRRRRRARAAAVYAGSTATAAASTASLGPRSVPGPGLHDARTGRRIDRPGRGERMSWLFKKIPQPEGSDRLFEPPHWDWAQAGDVGWWVRADWREALLGPRGLRLDEWQRNGQLTVVKTGPHRVVYRAELEQGAVYVKHFLVPDFRAKARQWFRRGKGRNEGRRTRYLAEIGVPTITPIALGEQRKRFFLLENYLITHAIPETVALDEFVERVLPQWPTSRQTRIRQELADALGIMTARLHDAGFVHQDFHPGNVLVRMDESDRPRLAMIDLDALRVCDPLGWPEARLNLALLNHYFWLRCGRSDRYRFLRTYLRSRKGPCPDPAAFARGIEAATRAWAERLWRRWGRRCQGTNKYFKKYRGRDSWSVASRDLDPDVVRALLADPDGPFSDKGTVLLKESRTTTVAETTLTVRGRPTRVIYKRFNRRAWIDPLLTWFRPSRAWQSWQAGQHLAGRGIPTPQNLMFLARLRSFRRDPLFWYLPHETYLVTIKEEPSITLGDYVNGVLPTLDAETRRVQIRRLTLALARLLRMLHERSLSDRDLKASNLLILGDPASPDVRLSVIDLVGVRLIHPLPDHRRIQNLARLHLSLADVVGRTRTDALVFLRAYLTWGLSPHNDWKSIWRAIATASQEKRERNRRRGRALS